MASIIDIIKQNVGAAAGGIEIPANIKDKVVNGLSESVLGSLTQTISKPGGIDALKNLLGGKVAAESSPVTQLAGNLFSNNILKNLSLPAGLGAKLSGIIPTIMGKLSGIIKDVDGDGDVDFQDILLTLKGGAASTASAKTTSGGGILGKVLGGILGKK